MNDNLDQKIEFIPSEKFARLAKTPIAYFSSEYALDNSDDQFAGGLGVLAGDMVLQASEDGLPFIAIGLKYGDKIPGGFEVLSCDNEPVLIPVPIKKKNVFAKIWVKKFGDSAYVFLLDSDVDKNSLEDRKITFCLYDPDLYMRLSQQMVMGIGGARLIRSLSINPSIFHINEGHAAFAALAVIAEEAHAKSEPFSSIKELLKNKLVATKHTIFSEAGMYIDKKDFFDFLELYASEEKIDLEGVFSIGQYEKDHNIFSTMRFALYSVGRRSGVSITHTLFEKERHPESFLLPITNGVSKSRWTSLLWNGLSVLDMKVAEIWKIKNALRKELILFTNAVAGTKLNKDTCTVVWARRLALYKRPMAIFSNNRRLADLCSGKTPVQFIISGKAHSADEEGQKIEDDIRILAEDPSFNGKIAFIPGYSIDVAMKLTAGADIWLNTPERGKEACGTSGMKAGLNGGLVMSVPDGWVDEIDWKGKGWILPDKDISNAIYDFLETESLPEFYLRNNEGAPEAWVNRMKATMEIAGSRYGAERMLSDYISKLYQI